MVYRTEREAQRRVFTLARVLGVWPGYFWSKLAGGWVLTYDPPGEPSEYKGMVLL